MIGKVCELSQTLLEKRKNQDGRESRHVHRVSIDANILVISKALKNDMYILIMYVPIHTCICPTSQFEFLRALLTRRKWMLISGAWFFFLNILIIHYDTKAKFYLYKIMTAETASTWCKKILLYTTPPNNPSTIPPKKPSK